MKYFLPSKSGHSSDNQFQLDPVHDDSELSLVGETCSRSYIEMEADVLETVHGRRSEIKRCCVAALGTAGPATKRQYEPMYLPRAKRPPVAAIASDFLN